MQFFFAKTPYICSMHWAAFDDKEKRVTSSWFRKSRLKLWGRKIENTSRCSYVLSPTANSFFKRLCLQDIDKKASRKFRLRLHPFFSNYYFFSFLQPLSLEERLETFWYAIHFPTVWYQHFSLLVIVWTKWMSNGKDVCNDRVNNPTKCNRMYIALTTLTIHCYWLITKKEWVSVRKIYLHTV